MFLLIAALFRLLFDCPIEYGCCCPRWFARLQPSRRAPHGVEWQRAEAAGVAAAVIDDATRCARECCPPGKDELDRVMAAIRGTWLPRADAALAPFALRVGGVFAESHTTGDREDGNQYHHIVVVFVRAGRQWP